MMRIFIGSTGEHAGLTLVIWAIIRRLMEKKYSPGFFKPFGADSLNDNETGMDPISLNCVNWRHFSSMPVNPLRLNKNDYEHIGSACDL